MKTHYGDYAIVRETTYRVVDTSTEETLEGGLTLGEAHRRALYEDGLDRHFGRGRYADPDENDPAYD